MSLVRVSLAFLPLQDQQELVKQNHLSRDAAVANFTRSLHTGTKSHETHTKTWKIQYCSYTVKPLSRGHVWAHKVVFV